MRVTEHVPPELESYRTVTPLAPASLGLAVLSLLGLLSPLMMPLAGVGLAVSWVALRRIEASGGTLSGKRMAILAFFVCVFMLACIPTRAVMHRRLLIEQAQQHAGTWFETVAEGRLMEAHQLTKREDERQARGVDLNMYYAKKSGEEERAVNQFADDPYPLREMEEFYEGELIAEVVAALRAGEQARHVGSRESLFDQYDGAVRINLLYQVADTEFLLQLVRRVDARTGETTWQLDGVLQPDIRLRR